MKKTSFFPENIVSGWNAVFFFFKQPPTFKRGGIPPNSPRFFVYQKISAENRHLCFPSLPSGFRVFRGTFNICELIDSTWFWFSLIDSDWCWLMLFDSDWFWLIRIHADAVTPSSNTPQSVTNSFGCLPVDGNFYFASTNCCLFWAIFWYQGIIFKVHNQTPVQGMSGGSHRDNWHLDIVLWPVNLMY